MADPDDIDPVAAAAIERAAAAADLLAELDRRIVFIDGGDGVIAQLTDGAGTVLRTLTASELLGVLDALGRR